MAVTKDIKLPTAEELTVEEANFSAATLLTAAPYVGKMCENFNNEFVLCRQELRDPRPCVGVGKQVTACTLGALRKIKRECFAEFQQYATCVEKSSGNFAFRHCRRTQAVFDTCMKDKACVDRPDFGYFCRGRVHKTTRAALPKEPCPCTPVVPDPTPSLPDCKERKPPRFGGRSYYMTE